MEKEVITMNTKGLMAGMWLAILILTTTGAALDFNAAFSTVYGKVTDGGAGVNGAEVSLTANGVTITTKTMTNNRGETGFYIFELANIPNLADTTPLTLSVTVGNKSATTTITKGGSGLQHVDLVPVSTTPALTTITVTPATASVVVGGTQIFTAESKDQFGNAIAATVTWSSSNPNVGNINAAGVFTAVAAGTATITAANGSISGTAILTVATPVLTTITVSPQTATVVVGNNRSFGAAAFDQLGNPVTATITWSSSNTTVGTINAATGLFMANAEGVTTIKAASGGVNGTATVTATQPVLTSITVSPDTATVAVGNTQTFTAATLDQVGNPIAAVVTWNSSNTTVGTISAGVFTAKTEGITTITAARGGLIGIATATVVPAGAVTPQLPSTGGSSGSSGGGGGGGGTSGENYINIVLKEKYEKAIYKDKPTSYKFKNASNPVMFINITGNFNAGLVNTAVEVLKATSTLVEEPAPSIAYKYINIWVGTSGFATSKNIKEATVVFRVENSWIDSNAVARSDINLVKWDGGKWITLETSEKMKDSTYTYFEGKTTSFSPFAIIATKGETMPAALPQVISPEITPSVTSTGVSPEDSTPINLAVVAVAIVLIAIVVVLYIRRR